MVTGTVVDPQGIPYAGGTIQAVLTLPVGAGGATLNGAQVQGQTGRLTLDSTGSFLMQLPDNAVVLPGGTQWRFDVSISPGVPAPAGTGPQSFSVTLTITGASQSISTQLQAAASKLGAGPLGGTHSGTETFNNIASFSGNTNGDTALSIQPASTGLTNASFTHISPNFTIVGSGPHQAGGAQPNTALGWYRTYAGTSANGVDGGLFAISIPSGYTGTAGVGNTVNSLDVQTWTQDANHYAPNFVAQNVCDATSHQGCWAANLQLIMYGANGATGQNGNGLEVDCVNLAASTTFNCIEANGPGSSTNPTQAIAFSIVKPTWPSGFWNFGYSVSTGATGASNPAIQISPVATGVSQVSQFIQLQATNSGGSALTGKIQVDTSGNMNVQPATGGFIRNPVAGSGIQINSSGGFFTQLTNTATAFRSIVFPDASGNVVLDTSAQTLTQKTLTSPVINGGSINPVNLLLNATAPTISSGFGTSPSIASNNGTAAFTVNVGTGGTASSGVIGLPTATTGWVCTAFDVTNPTTGGGYYVKQTAGTTTTATLTGYNTAGAATAWTASDILRVSCFAY